MPGAPNPKADFFFDEAGLWEPMVRELRRILLTCDLDEHVKWGKPCFMSASANIVLIQTFKAYCALLFPKGALLNDPAGILVAMTNNVQAARQMRFERVGDVTARASDIASYVDAAIANERAGLKVEMKDTSQFEMAREFRQRLDEMPRLRKAFEGLTPGRQRAYLLHFSAAKQSKTRLARVDRNIDRILEGLGLND